ncbi:AzlC family ABC transporter permease [Lederbergia wuyishanensis]|uniref:4-azaleucine resistance transporter AzlC n=1 Tax=Lederbergia wuyishanensis TaxID=1347903 RepID=A0ABU0CYU2_9BACI|nr:AzlC family ABC transporter permease [Lederbergia wuyishanensis]MCJ8005950.1 AzlC family ABC transporter permease [Lederbergia wuyishanensis]MDQ0341315.1 4-azaleucine resistance transporter AzlC [Lederbergia wuyishanensis]
MEASVPKVKYTEFRRGLHEGVSIAIGYAPIALTYGLLAKTTGLTLFETVLMSLVLYAGASQYIALNMFALGTGAAEMILTTFIVNIRHFLMSASLNEKVEEEVSWKKALYAFGVTDETFSVAATKTETVSTGYLFGLNIIAYTSWVIFSGIGFGIGAGLPQVLQESMAIALYAMFIGLLVPSMKKSMKVVSLALLAAVFNSIFVFSEIISKGWAIVVATILSAIIVEAVETMKRRGAGEG